jgi:hypothetical protein
MGSHEAPAGAQTGAPPDEIAQLRGQVVALERELAVQAARANAIVADAQRRTYWLDRLNLDLDVTLGRAPVRIALLAALAAVRRARRVRGRIRRLRGR